MKMVQVNSDKLKKMSNDPVAIFLDTVNQLEFIVSLPPTLNKDIRQIRIENFHRSLFNKGSYGAAIKNEILKLQQGVREPLTAADDNACLKNVSVPIEALRLICMSQVTYESLLHMVEDLLREHRFHSGPSGNKQ